MNLTQAMFYCHREGRPCQRTVFWLCVPNTHHLITACWVHADGLQLAGKPAKKKKIKKMEPKYKSDDCLKKRQLSFLEYEKEGDDRNG